MIIKRYQKPYVPKYANYDYTKVYDGNGRFIGWIKIYYTLAKVVEQMADITNKNELKRRIELFLDELDYSINEDFCKETMKMMREFIGHASHRLDCEESRVKSLKSKLKNYKDLEEQGLLLRLPCKIGDTVWDNDYGKPCAYTITGFSFGTGEDYIDEPVSLREVVCYYSNYSGSITGSFAVSEIGKNVFLTQEEAEQKLNEMESD